jgi:prepilin-type N-terminal cleavage/methylation domain-containing protein
VKPSTTKTVADRAVLCQRGSELAEFASLLGELGLSVDVHTGELPTAEVLAGACLVVVAGQRLAEGRPVALRSWPRTLAVVDDGSKTLAAHLHRIGVAMIIRRPIHPRALRLLLLHELYRGPERRAKKRVLIGHPIRTGGGLFKQSATLLELSRTGARIALANPPKIGSLIQFVLGRELTNAKPIRVRARVVRAIAPTSGTRAGESEVGVALLDPVVLAKPIQAILDRFALGPASTGSGLRTSASAPAARVAPTTSAARATAAAPGAPSPASPKSTPPPAPMPHLPAATPASAAAAAPTAPPEPRRLPPSYQPAVASGPIATASLVSEPALPAPCPEAEIVSLRLDAADTEIEVLETDFDLELELDDEDESDAESTFDEDPTRQHEAERRRSARVPYEQRVVALDAQAARVVVGRDLCLGGMRIAANPEIAVGDVLRLALHAGSETQPLVVLAGVERDDGEDGLVLAFAALTVPQRERLEKILALSGAIQSPAEDQGGEGDSLVVGELLARVARGREATTSRAGFTLIELMIVVAIIGLISSVAMPLFGRYQLRSKSAEVVTNLGAIRVVQEAHFSEHGAYMAANAEPALIPGPNAVAFDIAGTAYADMGWSPEGRVYFSYAVATSPDATGYTADAAADIDGNGILQLWGYVKPDPLGGVSVGGLGCNPWLLQPEVIGSCTVGSPAF